MTLELHIQRAVTLRIAGEDHDSAGDLVETMDDEYLPVIFFKHLHKIRRVLFPSIREDGKSGGFIHNQNLFNFVKDFHISILHPGELSNFLTPLCQKGYDTSMNDQPANTEFNPFLIDSLLHPLAGPIRQLLTREGRRELNQILIDDEENILQALEAGVQIESVYFAGEEVISETLRKKLTPGATIHEVAKRTTKKTF